jgi:3-oxoacyl-[acyl-carrier protein] reductase
MDLGYADATALVQGGTKGMGKAAAMCFAEEGAKVAVIGRDQEAIDSTVVQLREAGAPDALGLRADVTDLEQVNVAFATVGEQWGHLNVLVNAAGDAVRGGIEELSDDDWRSSVDLVALGMTRCVRAALPMLRAAGWARIVNLSAISTNRQSPSLIAYTAAKAMVTSITKNLSQSLAPDAILVNTVSPGPILSDAMERVVREAGGDPTDLRGVMQGLTARYGHPSHLDRVGTPEEVGAVVAFLASRRNSYMTGANINVDGGTDFC